MSNERTLRGETLAAATSSRLRLLLFRFHESPVVRRPDRRRYYRAKRIEEALGAAEQRQMLMLTLLQLQRKTSDEAGFRRSRRPAVEKR